MTERRPQIAILTPNTLAGIGLSGIIGRMMPKAEVRLFADFESFRREDTDNYFHFFTSVRTLMENAAFFLARRHKTIVLVHGNERGHLPEDFHTLNVYQEEEALIRSILRLAQESHSQHPEALRRTREVLADTPLTPREIEVLRLITSGLINKEIAVRLNVSLTTIISHRKNLTEKLGIKSVSGLTIYAVMHGIIKAEEI